VKGRRGANGKRQVSDFFGMIMTWNPKIRLMYQGQQLLGRRRIAGFDLVQDLGNVGHWF